MTDLSFIIQEVSERTGISIEEIKGTRRKREIVFARHAYCYIARNATKCSLKAIAEFIGRDHSTAINSIEFVEGCLDMPWEAKRWKWCDEVAQTIKVLNSRVKPTTLIGREIMKAHDYFMMNDYDNCARTLKIVLNAIEPNMDIEALAIDQKMYEEATR